MNSRIITREDERLAVLFQLMENLSEEMENIVRNSKPELECGQYLTDRNLSNLLKISRRCLQDYRKEGKIPYYCIGGKILYRASDIEYFLEKHYKNKHSGKSFTGI